MGKTRRKGGSRKRRGGFLGALRIQAAKLKNAATEVADKAHQDTLKGISDAHKTFETTAHKVTQGVHQAAAAGQAGLSQFQGNLAVASQKAAAAGRASLATAQGDLAAAKLKATAAGRASLATAQGDLAAAKLKATAAGREAVAKIKQGGRKRRKRRTRKKRRKRRTRKTRRKRRGRKTRRRH